MKQAILGWSFRQNIFLASLLQKSSISTHEEAAVISTPDTQYLLIMQDHAPAQINTATNEVIYMWES